MGSSSPNFGMKHPKIFELPPPSMGVEPKIGVKPPKWMVKIMEKPESKMESHYSQKHP